VIVKAQVHGVMTYITPHDYLIPKLCWEVYEKKIANKRRGGVM
jgi:hypothetical protein